MKQGSEAAFQQQILNLATLYNWSSYHTHDSRRSQPGFPDLVLVRDGDLIFAELKTAKGKVRPEQAQWLALLENVEGVEVYLWRTDDWDAIQARLSRGRHRLERAA
jgi:hypothetical protein